MVFTSDQHFGVGSNLILPGRGWFVITQCDAHASYFTGKDMGDGWETKRSREPAHKDWAIIELYAFAHSFRLPVSPHTPSPQGGSLLSVTRCY